MKYGQVLEHAWLLRSQQEGAHGGAMLMWVQCLQISREDALKLIKEDYAADYFMCALGPLTPSHCMFLSSRYNYAAGPCWQCEG